MRSLTQVFLTLLGVGAQLCTAHKEPKTPEEIEVQRALQAAAYHCAPTVDRFTAARKKAWAQQVLAGRSPFPAHQTMFNTDILSDAFDTPMLPTAENQTLMGCTPVFTATIQNNTCVLTPELPEGPYYHEAGHPLRQNIAELQSGLLLLLDIGVIDVNTCKPLPNVLVDVWQANATGHYSGHGGPSPDEPPVPDPYPITYPRIKPNETFLRGAWPTDDNGVVQFTTIFPGYYKGRATHVHARVLPEWKPFDNGTFSTGRVVHVGQFFVDDEINAEVDKASAPPRSVPLVLTRI
ncbi:hypothetical protein NP233_g7748 [Leucocoprinus birnbaumii]|uniref:Intradiol ring-cleavage dioxygenases domain-containing protein n=1 Tax=Leucocoprinus birnbaumii TaxID=56174 RepID=A0AAD5VNR3_9AGAR|nr:hypothetical protein NP233_g7748 [Leucocoprinus birnbaumii]